MDLQEFIKNLSESFEDTDPNNIKAETNFQELEDWSSLTILEIIALAKTKLGKTITGKEIRGCKTIEELYNLIVSK